MSHKVYLQMVQASVYPSTKQLVSIYENSKDEPSVLMDTEK
ncbi:hypothetical protein HMPREF9069_00510 [Atopobium sp. oral taxon 810 str. F0209]|nr:hypothetical protein HMPREF9069_00510 [Atopobium sp. oral taxon 810 str. F0209]